MIFVNPTDRRWTRHRYVLALGAYGWTRVCVWANSLEDALDEAVDWATEHAPGFIYTDEVKEEYRRLVEGGMSEEEAADAAEADMICAGNAGDYVRSDEWHIVAEDPTRAEMLELLGRAA